MTIFVTGSTGFIGQHLLKNEAFNSQLSPVYAFRDPHSSKLAEKNKVKFDFNNHNELIHTVEKLKPTSALLAGWQGLPNYSPETCLLNHYNQLVLIHHLIKNDCTKIVLTGSCWQYGDLTGQLTEDRPQGITGIFADTKNSIFEFAKKMALGTQCKIVDTRIFFVYGPGQRTSSIIPATIESLKATGSCQIRTPNVANDFIHIDDTIEALVKILQFDFKESTSVNIGSGEPRQVKEVVNIICKNLGLKAQYDTNYETNGFWANNEFLKSLGWNPKVTLEEGIKDFISKS